jgi:outer membrane immunogenic protein
MKRSLLLSGTAAVALVLAGAAANAADIVEPEPEPMLFDWSGIYIGGHAGAGAIITHGTFDNSDAFSAADLGDLSDIGFIGGGQIGFNWQAGNIVFGVEGDISFPDWDDEAIPPADDTTPGVSSDYDFLASVRGRLGWADDNVLFYVTGGIAWLEAEIKNDENWCDFGACSLDVSDTGGVAGAGIEWGVTEMISLRAEGLYYFGFDKQNLDTDDNDEIPEADPGDSFEFEDALVARLGINIRFNPFR